MPDKVKLTKAQVRALVWLRNRADGYPANDYGFLPTYHPQEAAACRSTLEIMGLVRINRQAENSFRYSITPAGRQALEAADGQ